MAEAGKSTTKEKAAKTKKESHKEQEKLLNRELEDSFPASDPPSLTQPTTEMGVRIVSATKRSKAGAETDPGSAFTTAALPDRRASIRKVRLASVALRSTGADIWRSIAAAVSIYGEAWYGEVGLLLINRRLPIASCRDIARMPRL
jgi:hypothetical protein